MVLGFKLITQKKFWFFIYFIFHINGIHYYQSVYKYNEHVKKRPIVPFNSKSVLLNNKINEKKKYIYIYNVKYNNRCYFNITGVLNGFPKKISKNDLISKKKVEEIILNNLRYKKNFFFLPLLKLKVKCNKNDGQRNEYFCPLSKIRNIYKFEKSIIHFVENNSDKQNIEEQKKKKLIEKKKELFLNDNIEKKYLLIDYIDEKNETSDILLKVHIKSKLREYYYDLCVKEYKEKKLLENKYEYSYLNDVPINNLINYIDKNEYMKIFLKYVNDDIIKVYKSVKGLHLIGSPRLLNNVDHLCITKFDDILLKFSIDKYPTIIFQKPYINLDIKVKIPPYEKGTAFKEFLKIVENKNDVIEETDKNHKVEWNNDVQVNVSRGWVYNFSNVYYDEYCKMDTHNRDTLFDGMGNNENVQKKNDKEKKENKQGNSRKINNLEKERKETHGLSTNEEDKKENEKNKDQNNNTNKEQIIISNYEKNFSQNNKINNLIDIDKDEENFINNSDKYMEQNLTNDDNDEKLFNDSYENKSHYEFLKNADFTNYFRQGYQLPNDVISMNNETISVKENFNPLGFNESLLGMGKNEKKNITVYIPVNLFKEYFQKEQEGFEKRKKTKEEDFDENIINLKEIDKDSITKFREIIYTEIKKLKNNRFLQKIEKILKGNENKFFDSDTLEKSLKRNENEKNENNDDNKDEEKKNDLNSNDYFYLKNNEQSIDSILSDHNITYDEEEDDIKESEERDINENTNDGINKIEEETKEDDVEEQNEEIHFNKNFDKYLKELLKDDINSLDEKLYNQKEDKTKEIFQNLYDFNEEYSKDQNVYVNDNENENKDSNLDTNLHDYILGESDLIKCVLEIEVLDIKIRKKGNEDVKGYVLRKYNKTIDELYEDIESRAMKDIQSKCVQERRMEAYKKLMEITSLNIPMTLFHAQGKRLYSSYLNKMKMKNDENKENKILCYEEYIKRSEKEIYDQIKFSFIVKSIFQNSKLQLNYEEIIKDVIKTLIKTPTNNIRSLIKRIYTIHQAQYVLDFVSLNSNISFHTDDKSAVNFSVSFKKGSEYSQDDYRNHDEQLTYTTNHITNNNKQTDDNNKHLSNFNSLENNVKINQDKNFDILNNNDENTKEENKIFHFKDESNFVVEKKKENNENIQYEYFTFKKGANYTKYFQDNNVHNNPKK
ncbi:hypothetical protein PRSY57_1426300 [Plasmodium reichenowi]|uniref:Trigger factor C-terminal domain-containing protein n=1 Tax=Plasmodium reichenowi TaxID=5854 RepID=A0A151L4P4_PLARE|nr:hypothetical protein PRSY57_1426300 [Plasmodium reichenowi]KYN93921.1 hypothetical protein PRSY57_1426300 [Plasmodium reichenowi]